MENVKYRPRVIDPQVDEYLAAFGALCIEGPKWCGKTWTAAAHAQSEIDLGDPTGDFQNRRLAEMDPSLVLEGEAPRLIDEWQEVPPLWDAVRYRVDRSEKGQFILTGSATPNHKGILHSGAGRIARLRMRPMSLYESGESSGTVSLEALCRGELTTAFTGEVALSRIISYIVRGGWPGSLGLSDRQAALVPAAYLTAVLDDDVYRMDGVRRDTRKMRLLLRSLARNESTTASNKTLMKDVLGTEGETLDADTVAGYLDIFRRLFLTENQPPFAPPLRSALRVKQAEKRHLADPSLAAALLGATPDMLMRNLETLGFLFEALCERDLAVYAESFGAKLYHYQDYRNQEIDAVIALPDGEWCAFEIKLGANQIDGAAENLLKIKKQFEEAGGKPPRVLCVLCGLSRAAYVRPDGVFVVPLTAMKN